MRVVRRVLAGFNGADPNVNGMLGVALTIEELLSGPLKGASADKVIVSCQGAHLGTVATVFTPAGGVSSKAGLPESDSA